MSTKTQTAADLAKMERAINRKLGGMTEHTGEFVDFEIAEY